MSMLRPDSILPPDTAGAFAGNEMTTATSIIAPGVSATSLGPVRQDAVQLDKALHAEVEDILESITDGFVAVDAEWRYTYCNSAASRLIGSLKDLIGRNMWEAFPEIVGTVFEEPYRRAMRDRVSITIEGPWGSPDALFECKLYPMANGGLAFSFRNVTQARLMERSLRESERRQRFLAESGLELQGLADPDEILAATVRLLGEELGADRCIWVLIEEDENTVEVRGEFLREGMPSQIGRWQLSDFSAVQLALYRHSLPFLIEDTDLDDRLLVAERKLFRQQSTRANLAVCVLREGRLVAGIGVNMCTPRAWSNAEISLVQEVASRSWDVLERARTQKLQRESERRFRELADAMPQIVYVTGADGIAQYLNQHWIDYAGLFDSKDLSLVIHPDELDRALEGWERARALGEPIAIEFRMRDREGCYR